MDSITINLEGCSVKHILQKVYYDALTTYDKKELKGFLLNSRDYLAFILQITEIFRQLLPEDDNGNITFLGLPVFCHQWETAPCIIGGGNMAKRVEYYKQKVTT